jgi:hypothetical protein
VWDKPEGGQLRGPAKDIGKRLDVFQLGCPRGTNRFSIKAVFGELGVLQLSRAKVETRL